MPIVQLCTKSNGMLGTEWVGYRAGRPCRKVGFPAIWALWGI